MVVLLRLRRCRRIAACHTANADCRLLPGSRATAVSETGMVPEQAARRDVPQGAPAIAESKENED